MPRGNNVLMGNSAGVVWAWDARSGRELWTARHAAAVRSGASAVRGLAASPDGKFVASSSYDDTVRVWKAATGQQVYRLPGHGRFGRVEAPLGFTPDSQRLLSAGDDLFLRAWDVRTGKAKAEHRIRPPGVEIPENEDGEVDGGPGYGQPLVSPAGGMFTMSLGDKILVYDIETGRVLREVPREIGNTWCQTLSPDGKHLVAGEEGPKGRFPDGRWRAVGPDVLRTIDLATGKTVRITPLANEVPRMIVFSPDGSRFATAGRMRGRPIDLWRTSTGEHLGAIGGLDAQVTCLAFSADNRLLVSGFFDTTALVWDIAEAARGKPGPKGD
jgi:WD40 repeat protein